MIYPRCVRSESRPKRLANRYARSLAVCSVCFLATFISAFPQLEHSPDIPELLREVKRNSDENWRRVIVEYPNYTYKWRKVWRRADKKG